MQPRRVATPKWISLSSSHRGNQSQHPHPPCLRPWFKLYSMNLQTPSRALLRGLTMVVVLSAARAYSQEPVDLSTIHRIKAEAFENSKIMDKLFYLTHP